MQIRQKVAMIVFSTLLLQSSNGRVFSSVTSQDARSVELETAKQHFKGGDFSAAINLLDRLLVTSTLSNDNYVEASEYLAVSYVTIGQDSKAEGVFDQILQRAPNYKPSDQWWPHRRLMTGYYRTLKKTGQSLGVSAKDPGIRTIAIMDFENNSIDDADKYTNLGNALSKILIGDFAVVNDLRVVERERIQFLIDELELTAKKISGQNVVDQDAAPRLGKLLGAHAFVFGSFIRLGKVFRIDARLVKTETGEIFKTASVEGKPSKILQLAKELTLKISKDLDVAIQKAERKRLNELGREDVPIEAVALFGDAMSSANQEDYKDAVIKLEEAIAIAPNFQKALDMAEVIRPLTL